MMMLKVIARTVGLHHLILLNFYPFLQRYVQVCYLVEVFLFKIKCNCLVNRRQLYSSLQPHQKDITNLLAAAVQACHDMVWFSIDCLNLFFLNFFYFHFFSSLLSLAFSDFLPSIQSCLSRFLLMQLSHYSNK